MNNLTKITLLILLGVGGYYGYLWYSQIEIKKVEVMERSMELETLALSEPGKCLSLLQNLWKDKKSSAEELLLLAELSMDTPSHTPSDKLIDQITKLLPNDLNSKVLSACFEYVKGNTLQAINQLNRLQLEYPNSQRATYELNKIFWVSGAWEDRIKAKVALRELANFEGKWSYKALRVLCFTPPGPGFLKEDLEQAIKDLKSHELITSNDFLKCLDMEIAVSEGFDIDSAITEAKVHLDNPVRPEDLGFWLIKRSRPNDALDVVTEQIALDNIKGFFARFQGMLETNRTTGAKKLLNQYRVNLSNADELRAQTYWAISIGKKNPLSDYLFGAKSINSAESLLDVARLALLSNQSALAVEAFGQAWEIDPDTFGLDQANQYLQISLSMRNTKQAYDITKNLNARFPYKFGNANNLCYLSLLLGEDSQSMEKEAERIIRSFPQNPSFLSTLALAKTMNGKYQEAYDTMSRRRGQILLHGERALMAVILQNIDKQEDAQKISSSLEEQRMLPEEWAMLKKHNLIKPKG